MIYAPLEITDADALIDVLSRAFGISPADERIWMFDRAGIEQMRAVRSGDQIVAGCALLPMAQYFGGHAIAMGGLAGVGVRSDARRAGVASTLMRGVLNELRERGVPLSTLFASNAPLYRGVGYETAGARYRLTLPARDLAVAERTLEAKIATPADAPELRALYMRVAEHKNGHLERCRYIWPRLHGERFGLPAHGLVFRDLHGDVEAYVYWRQKPGDLFFHVEVTDAVSATARGLRTIWAALGDLRPMAQDIVIPTAPTDPLYLALADPRFELRHHHAWMVRIVDVARALEARGYPESITARLELRVHDEVLVDNGGCYVLEIADGRGQVERGGGGGLELDVRALASLFTGFVDPWSLATTGGLRGDAAGLSRLSACFGDGTPWMPEMF